MHARDDRTLDCKHRRSSKELQNPADKLALFWTFAIRMSMVQGGADCDTCNQADRASEDQVRAAQVSLISPPELIDFAQVAPKKHRCCGHSGAGS